MQESGGGDRRSCERGNRICPGGDAEGDRIIIGDMSEEYYKGVFAAYLGANFISGPVSEWQIDAIKESLSRYGEAMIDHSLLSYLEKEEQKRQMKLSLEGYIKGVKDEMKATGRMK